MNDVITIENRNGAVEVRADDAAPRAVAEGVFDILSAENLVRVRFFDIASADVDRVQGFENLVLTMSREAARELAALLTRAVGQAPEPRDQPPSPPPTAPRQREERATLYEL